MKIKKKQNLKRGKRNLIDCKKLKKPAKGITLIALVITIIVLLILAAVSIATLTGENGILSKATEAKEKTTESQEMEEIQIAYSSLLTNSLNQVIKASDLQAELQKNGERTVYESGEGYIVFFQDSKNWYKYENGKVSKTEIYNFEDIKIGDYINYPIYYDNVMLGDISISNDNNKWRVLEKVEENGENYIKIIPTGVPLNIEYDSIGKNLKDIWEYPYIFSDPNDTTTGKSYSHYIKECGFKDLSKEYMEYVYDLKNLFVNNIYTQKDENFNPIVEFLNKKDIENLLQMSITETISIVNNDLLSISTENGYANIIIQDNDTNEVWCIDAEGNFKTLTDTGIYGLLPVVTLKSDIMFSISDEKIDENMIYDIFIDESEEQYPENHVLYANFARSYQKRNRTTYFKIITNMDVAQIQVTNVAGREENINTDCTKYNNLNMWEISWNITSFGNLSFTVNLLDENEEIIYTTTKSIYSVVR